MFDKEFKLNFQPIYSSDLKLKGCEVLMQGDNLEEFFINLDLNEEFLLKYTKQVFDKVVNLIISSQIRFDEVYFSINISPKLFFNQNFMLFLEENKDKFLENNLILEVVERNFPLVNEIKDFLDKLEYLSKLGYNLFLDDYSLDTHSFLKDDYFSCFDSIKFEVLNNNFNFDEIIKKFSNEYNLVFERISLEQINDLQKNYLDNLSKISFQTFDLSKKLSFRDFEKLVYSE